MPRVLLATVSVALLAALQVADAVVPSSTVPYDGLAVTSFETQNVTSTSVENVKFVKFITVASTADDRGISSMSITLPGRIFIENVDYQDGGEFVNSSTLIQAKISGDVFDLVDGVDVWSFELIDFVLDTAFGTPTEVGHLLVELSVFRANSILDINVVSPGKTHRKDAISLEAVVGNGVVYSRNVSSSVSESSDETVTISAMGKSNLYVQSASTQLDLSEFIVITYDQANIYVDGGVLTASKDVSAITDSDTSIIALFDSIETDLLSLSADDGGTICLVVSNSLEADDDYVPEPANVMLPGESDGIDATGSFACSRMKIPDRKPRNVSLTSVSFTPSGEAIVSPTEGNSVPPLLCGGVLTAITAFAFGFVVF